MAGDFQISTGTFISFPTESQQPPPFIPFTPVLPQKGFCSLTIQANSSAGLSPDQLTSAEQEVASLFGHSIGVDFGSSGPVDYTLNFVNAGPSNTNFGQQSSFLFIQFSPNVYVNNISNAFIGWPSATINNIIGTVAAHELVHRITNIGDLPYNHGSPNDLMSLDNNPNAANLLVNNGFQLTPNEAQQLAKKCQKKHPD